MCRSLLSSALLIFALAVPAHAAIYTDWTSVDLVGNTAVGMLGSTTVTLTGGDIVVGITNGTMQGFNSSFFCPPVASTDGLEIIGTNPSLTYTLSFNPPLSDPVIHVFSLASTLAFSGVTLTGLCGQSTLAVTGNEIDGFCSGGGPQPTISDANGTVRINGLISSVSFTAFWVGSPPECPGHAPSTRDGITIQVGSASAVPNRPSQGIATLLIGMALTGCAALFSRRSADVS